MALVIQWTPQANKGLQKVIDYLEQKWTPKEILQLEKKINQVLKQIIIHPELFPKSDTETSLYKAIIDKNNYLVYRINLKKSTIEIINFRGTKQKPKY
ncbi:type II toxin-antitoxin system RelE/ParE family toxin [Flavobacterium sp.]|jgi:plasmid stabilization system protein ParE|uniref:type II toxin-antitoxin system RelE/ParE family toxin n=1 Tax=Flavobacterium sp. TaxID=239 RepID=UPI0037BE712A